MIPVEQRSPAHRANCQTKDHQEQNKSAQESPPSGLFGGRFGFSAAHESAQQAVPLLHNLHGYRILVSVRRQRLRQSCHRPVLKNIARAQALYRRMPFANVAAERRLPVISATMSSKFSGRRLYDCAVRLSRANVVTQLASSPTRSPLDERCLADLWFA